MAPEALPRKGYKTITVRVATFERFTRTLRKAKRQDEKLDNSTFLELLLRYARTAH